MSAVALTPEAVLDFWQKAGPQKWFDGGPAFDAEVRTGLLPAFEAAAGSALDSWQGTAPGALARIILLDQVPRNVFRGTPRAFATDAMALAGAERAVDRGFDKDPSIPEALRSFFYLPFMHAEDKGTQARCVALYRVLGNAENLEYALIHKDAIDRFGRFPHRNAILGRPSTPEEEAYLKDGGFSG
ncbi:DUF924 family protein [Xanthobacter sp. KR7-65]|uniref:DUF924 family protein n=1 Tax=Xanthobacter sp. KR7-65 TaxID=3156612 RepID=UPI0032B38A6C